MPSNESFKQMPPDGSERRVGRFRILLAKLPLVVLAVLLLIPFLLLMRHSQQSSARIRIQDAFVEQVKSQGGRVVLAPPDASGAPPPLLSVDLSDVIIDGDLIKRLSQFTSIERLKVDGAKLASGEYASIGRLPKLRHLSMADSTVSDNDLPWDSLRLTTLSLRNTSITDAGLSRLAEMTSLATLDISGTSITGERLSSLKKLPSLRTLEIDDDCITPTSVAALQSMKSLEVVRLQIADGFGRQIRGLLNPLAGAVSVEGLHPSGNVLWSVDDKPWDETLAGVVEAVIAEVGLDPQQVTQLIVAIGSTDTSRPPKATHSGRVPEFEPNGKEIGSVEEFLERLREPGSPPYEVRAYARDRFTKEDLPKLLDALRAQTNLRDAEYLHRFGTYLLVRDGLPDPEAAEELSRMLSEENPSIRNITMYGFDRYGHPFHEDWAPSEAAAEFGVPWLIKLADDPNPSARGTVVEVLRDVTCHHPKHAAAALAVLIEMLARGAGAYTNHAIQRIAEVNPEAARVAFPEVRRLLEQFDEGTVARQLNQPAAVQSYHYSSIVEALCDLARGDPGTAHEAALDCLGQIRAGKAAGVGLPSLVAPGNSATVRTIVYELLEISSSNDPAAKRACSALINVAKAIRDSRAPEAD